MPSVARTEREVIKDIVEYHEEREVDSIWFVISAKWFTQWKEYVRYDEDGDELEDGAARPDAIDNTPLVIESASGAASDAAEFTELRKGLIENVDYVLVPADAWKKFTAWYDYDVALPRKVVHVGLTSRTMVDLYPIRVVIVRLQTVGGREGKEERPEKTLSLVMSRTMTIKLFRFKACAQLGVPPHRATLWVGEIGKRTALDDLNQTVDDYQLAQGQTVFVTSTTAAPDMYYGSSAYVPRMLANEEGNPPAPGVVGLYNLGNTCFMNSSLQCLSHVPALREVFLSGLYKSELNVGNPLGMKGALADEFHRLLREIWSGKFTRVVPRAFKTVLGQYAPQFVGYNPQDAGELLTFVLNGLHEEVKQGEMSAVSQLFGGDFRSIVTCTTCQHVMTKDELFYFVPLPVPASNERVVQFTYVPLDPARPLVKMGVIVNKTDNVQLLRCAAAAAVGIEPELALLAELDRNSKPSVLTERKSLLDVREGDKLVLYQLAAPLADKDNVILPVIHAAKDQGFGMPLMLAFPRGSRPFTAEFVLEFVMAQMPRFAGSAAPKGFYLNVTVPGKGDGKGEQAGDDGSADRKRAKEDEENVNSAASNQAQGQGHKGGSKTQKVDVSSLADLRAELDSHTRSVVIEWPDKDAYRDPAEVEDPSFKAKIAQDEVPVDLSVCLDMFARPERLDHDDKWFCPQCRELRAVSKVMAVQRAPEVLVINLKRFQYSRYKLDLMVRYPTEGLDISAYMMTPGAEAVPPVYDLVGVVHHKGSIGGGHYTAVSRDGTGTDSKWYLYDDQTCKEVTPEDVVTNNAYLLFYVRREKPISSAFIARSMQYALDHPLPSIEAAATSSTGAASGPTGSATAGAAAGTGGARGGPGAGATGAQGNDKSRGGPTQGSGALFQCPYCGRGVAESVLDEHLAACAATADPAPAPTPAQAQPQPPTKAPRMDSIYVCVFCETEFTSRSAYEQHEAGPCPKAV